LTAGGFLPGRDCSKERANPADFAGAIKSLKLQRYRSVIDVVDRHFLPSISGWAADFADHGRQKLPITRQKRPDSSTMREASGPELPAYLNSDMMLFGAWFAIERA
jgi:hypothetical protein